MFRAENEMVNITEVFNRQEFLLGIQLDSTFSISYLKTLYQGFELLKQLI